MALVIAIGLPWALAWAVRRARVEGRTLAAGGGRLPHPRLRSAVGPGRGAAVRRRPPGRPPPGPHLRHGGRHVKPPARAIVGNLVWSNDGGVWAVWQVTPFPHAHTASGRQAGRARAAARPAHEPAPDGDAALGLRAARPGQRRRPTWLPASTSTRRTPGSTCAPPRATGWRRWPSTSAATTWRRSCRPPGAPGGRCSAGAAGEVNSAFGVGPSPIAGDELESRRRQAREIEARLAASVSVRPGHGRRDLLAVRPGVAARGRRAGVRRGLGAPDRAAAPASTSPGGARPAHRRHREGGRLQGRPRPPPPPALRAHRRPRRDQLPDGPGDGRHAPLLRLPQRRGRVAVLRRPRRLPGRLVRAGQGRWATPTPRPRSGASTATSSGRSTSTTAR